MHYFSSSSNSCQHMRSYISMKLSCLSNSEVFRIFRDYLHQIHFYLSMKLMSFIRSAIGYVKNTYWFLVFCSNPMIVQLLYFISISIAGFLALKSLRPRHKLASPMDLDLFFTSVSTLTVSSMATVEMEDFSEPQLWVLILLMLLGGEIFTSMIGFQFMKAKAKRKQPTKARLESITDIESNSTINITDQNFVKCNPSDLTTSELEITDKRSLRQNSLKFMGYILAAYFVAMIVFSSAAIMIYLCIKPEAGNLVKSKGVKTSTFSIFTAVSSFVNCGFSPINMAIFRDNSILLLLLIPQLLVGNTLFPPCLRLTIWVLKKLIGREEYSYLLRHPRKCGYKHLYSHKFSVYMAITVLGLILVQMILLCCLEWNSQALVRMKWFQKLAAFLFQSTNTRHAGESVIDISTISAPILVLFAFMMYLPSNTSFLPISDASKPLANDKENKRRKAMWRNFLFPKTAYLVSFVILACVTERRSISADPLNFNVFSIIFEVISAYGNVGYSLGYSCENLLKPDTYCKNFSYGFVGKWSVEGRLIIIIVMFIGRLKRFNFKGGKAWNFF